MLIFFEMIAAILLITGIFCEDRLARWERKICKRFLRFVFRNTAV